MFKSWGYVLVSVLCWTCFSNVYSNSLTVTELLKRSENMMRGESQYIQMDMKITTPKWKRKITIQSWSKGTTLSLIHILYPPRDKGVSFLKRDQEMWQYIPKVERTIKIPTSMMMQSWMGSDFTNDDLVKESSLVNDYTAIIKERRSTVIIIELTPKPSAPVTWGKLIMHLHTKYYIPVVQVFYDELGNKVRKMEMDEIKKIGDRWVPHYWKVSSLLPEKKGHFTEIFIKEVVYDQVIRDSLFSLRELRRKSR